MRTTIEDRRLSMRAVSRRDSLPGRRAQAFAEHGAVGSNASCALVTEMWPVPSSPQQHLLGSASVGDASASADASRLDGVNRTPNKRNDAGPGLRDRPSAHARSRVCGERSVPSNGGRQEEVMSETTYRTTSQAERRVGSARMPWPFGLHRRAAVATAIGAICVFALQVRDRRSFEILRDVDAVSGASPVSVERRGESP